MRQLSVTPSSIVLHLIWLFSCYLVSVFMSKFIFKSAKSHSLIYLLYPTVLCKNNVNKTISAFPLDGNSVIIVLFTIYFIIYCYLLYYLLQFIVLFKFKTILLIDNCHDLGSKTFKNIFLSGISLLRLTCQFLATSLK